ncbi:MAG: transcription termination factor NusA [Actinomycetaceae bacterium]|nr:transcription termination factor NusA [Actinomycetaceae bacterium]
MEIDMAALRAVENERGISLGTLVDAIENALLKAYHNVPGALPKARVEIDNAGRVTVFATEEDKDGNPLGEFDDTPSGFGRIATQVARSMIVQRLKEAEDAQVLGEFADKTGTIVAGRVQQSRNPYTVMVQVGDYEAILPENEQIPGERLAHGDLIRAYVVRVTRTDKGARIELSRRHPELVRRLFEREVPELTEGVVRIESIAREAGYRTKIAVSTQDKNVNPKGACIGPMGGRVRAVMSDLGGEKIDVIYFSEDVTRFVANALSPAKVSSVTLVSRAPAQARVVVPDYQLSLAIGREGQNARLAARLTGCKIDIVPEGAAEPNLEVSKNSRPDTHDMAGDQPTSRDQ